MVLNYASKRGRELLTWKARCKIAGLTVFSLVGLWLSVGFLWEAGRDFFAVDDGCMVEVPRIGEPPMRSIAEARRRTALLMSALSLGGSLVCWVTIVRTRNMPESHRWSLG